MRTSARIVGEEVGTISQLQSPHLRSETGRQSAMLRSISTPGRIRQVLAEWLPHDQ